jgi:hypothetical protein
MTGFEIATSLGLIVLLLFYGRYMHNKERNELTDEQQFRKTLRERYLRRQL